MRIRESFALDAPYELVWRVLGDFGTEQSWAPALARTSRNTKQVQVGTIRTCELTKPMLGMTTVREAVEDFGDGKLSYSVVAPPWPFAHMRNTWYATRFNEQCIVFINAKLQLRRGLGFMALALRPMMQKLTRDTLAEFRRYMLAGAPHHLGPQ
jgi:hypothetical protein